MSQSNERQARYDVICFSHLRWNFVFQRPQHLLSRCAKKRRVFYVEEPVGHEGIARFDVELDSATGVHVVTPRLPASLEGVARDRAQKQLLAELLVDYRINNHATWFYTPMALPLAASLAPRACVYDCMDELSAFRFAPPELLAREKALLAQADVVFTGGQALYEHKKQLHSNIHAFPSSVDTAHFGAARRPCTAPGDQREIPGPRLGFFGVIDERMDLALLRAVAEKRPKWQIVLLGPVVKVDPDDLPRLPNLHYLGSKAYSDLPAYIAGWDVALLPFAKNDATRFISPTKTPEYLAAGKPVVSTSIRDVVRPYSVQGLARIADTPDAFVAACEAALGESNEKLLKRADPFLAKMSWDKTWEAMEALMDEAVAASDSRRSGEPFVGFLNETREVG
jgi:glycosyltransferase involved in cell wall biosynthesis